MFVLDLSVSQRFEGANIDLNDDRRFQQMQSLAKAMSDENALLSVAITLMWLRLIKYAVIMPSFGRVTFAFLQTITNYEV